MTGLMQASKKRRSFDPVTPELQPYTKKPKLIEKLLSINNPLRNVQPTNLITFQHIKFSWLLSHFLQIPQTPMFVGFNSLIYNDATVMQKVSYLSTINLSPTNKAVIRETMFTSLKVADECREMFIEVTYDLAIVKVALQIQSTDSPLFNRVFVHLGSFHIMMAYFKAIGTFIDNCGITNILVDSGILAGGSINSFIFGQHFNRCKKLHPIISLVFQILHFQQFLQESHRTISSELKNYLINFMTTQSSTPKINNQEVLNLFNEYELYTEKTLNGYHGKTPKFYQTYIQLVEYYLLLSASIRTGDFELFIFVLPYISNVFFMVNQPNYARYTVKYLDNLLRVDITHPGLKERFQNGSFGVKRTLKTYSRQPIDLTLEQTINADAANKLTGKKINDN